MMELKSQASETTSSSSGLLSPQSGEDKLKATLLSYHSENFDDQKRIDINKIVEDYQKKFRVPKVLIIKWLGLKRQSSQFKRAEPESIESSFLTGQSNTSRLTDDLEQSKIDEPSVSMTEGDSSKIIMLKAHTTKDIKSPRLQMNPLSRNLSKKSISSMTMFTRASPLRRRKPSVIKVKTIPKEQVTKMNAFLERIGGNNTKRTGSKKRLMFKVNIARSDEEKPQLINNSGFATARRMIPRKIQSSNVVIPNDLCSQKAVLKVVEASRQAQINRSKLTLPDLSNTNTCSQNKLFSPRRSIHNVYSPQGSNTSRGVKSPLRSRERTNYLNMFSGRKNSNQLMKSHTISDLFSPVTVKRNNFLQS